jgi:signal transduction histidine kinase
MELCLENHADPGALLRVDPEVVGQVLFNLVDNACKYASGAEDRRIHVETQIAGGQVRISVRDHGPGIAAERRRSIFRPFERGGDAVHAIPGVGLGLALSRGLAADMGGRLDLDDAAAGACFTLTLPLRAAGPEAPGPSRIP